MTNRSEFTYLIQSLKNKYSKFNRKGILKPLDYASEIKRVFFSTTRFFNYFVHKDVFRLIMGTVLYIGTVNYLFSSLKTAAMRQGVDISRPEFKFALNLYSDTFTYNLINDAMYMHSFAYMVEYEVTKKDYIGVNYCYYSPYMNLAQNRELTAYWDKICRSLNTASLHDRANEIILNYRIITYNQSAGSSWFSKLQYPTLHNAYLIADELINKQSIKKKVWSQGTLEIITNMLLPKQLFRFNEQQQDINVAMQAKYYACYHEIRRILYETLKNQGSAIDEQSIDRYAQCLYILYINTLHSSVDDTLRAFELSKINLASLTHPVKFDFKQKSADIILLHVNRFAKTLITFNQYIEAYSNLSDQQNMLYQGNFIRNMIGLKPASITATGTTKRQSNRDKAMDFANSMLVLYTSDPDHVGTNLDSRTYINKLKTKNDDYKLLVEEYNTVARYQYFAIVAFNYIISSSLLGFPSYLSMIKEDFCKYLFLYTTHEAWTGYSILFLSTLTYILHIISFGCIRIAYVSQIPIIDYVRGNYYIIELYRPLFMKYAITQLIRNANSIVAYIIVNSSIQYLLDLFTYFRYNYYFGSIYQAISITRQFFYSYYVYSGVSKTINEIDVIYSVANNTFNSYVSPYDTLKLSFVPSSFSGESIEYKYIYSIFAVTNTFKFRVLTNYSYLLLYFGVIFTFLKIKMWDWYFTPEQYIPT